MLRQCKGHAAGVPHRCSSQHGQQHPVAGRWLQGRTLLVRHHLLHLLHCSCISRTLRSSESKQLCLPKTKLNIGKCAFTVALPTVCDQLPITSKSSETVATFRKKIIHSFLKLLFHRKVLAVSCSNDNSCLSPFMIMPNDFVCCTSELELFTDVDAIDALQLLCENYAGHQQGASY